MTNLSSKTSGLQKIYFPNLDGIRFICFLLVFSFHSFKVVLVYNKDQVAYRIAEFLFGNGELGVNFFFVLSGFLITFLIIKEKEATGSINLKHFYFRRILRIWPLFYLCVFIGFLVFPIIKKAFGLEISEIANPIYYLFFLNNYDYINNWPQFPDALSLIVLWSVAVEEQFYLIWPILLKYSKTKYYPFIFFFVIIASSLFLFFHLTDSSGDYAIRNFHTFSVIGDMAMGGLMAYYCSCEKSFLKWVQNIGKREIIMLYLLAFYLFFFRLNIFKSSINLILERPLIAFVFALIIVEQNYSKNSLFKFSRHKFISSTGIYTYGLYCYHFLVLSIITKVIHLFDLPENSLNTSLLIIFISLIISIYLARFSYNIFEKPFLKLKDKFTIFSKK